MNRKILTDMKNYSNLNLKLANQKNRRNFLLRCKTQFVTPNFLNIRVKHIQFTTKVLERKFNENILSRFKRETLNLLISDTIAKIKKLEKNISKIKATLQSNHPQDVIFKFINDENMKYENHFLKVKKRNVNKFELLIKNFQISDKKQINIEKDWFENLTNTEIPDYAMEILSLGSNFAFPVDDPKDIPTIEIISSIETSINKLSNEKKDEIRANICNELTNLKKTLNTKRKQKKGKFYRHTSE